MIPCNFPVSLGEMIYIHRLRHKMSQSDLAKEVGISRNYVSLIERGNENVSYSVVLKICETLGLDVRIGMSDTQDNEKEK
jgi:transcriptional regulator with XRE-family HTH domain